MQQGRKGGGEAAHLRQPLTRLSRHLLAGASDRFSVSNASTAGAVPHSMAPRSGGTAAGTQRDSASAAAVEEESWCRRRSREPERSSAEREGARG